MGASAESIYLVILWGSDSDPVLYRRTLKQILPTSSCSPSFLSATNTLRHSPALLFRSSRPPRERMEATWPGSA